MTKKKFHGSRKRKDLWAQGELEGTALACGEMNKPARNRTRRPSGWNA
jgi:hypothetical protein